MGKSTFAAIALTITTTNLSLLVRESKSQVINGAIFLKTWNLLSSRHKPDSTNIVKSLNIALKLIDNYPCRQRDKREKLTCIQTINNSLSSMQRFRKLKITLNHFSLISTSLACLILSKASQTFRRDLITFLISDSSLKLTLKSAINIAS